MIVTAFLKTIAENLGDPKSDRMIFADWLEETMKPECVVYANRLRHPNRLRTQTVLDLLLKFGTKKERCVALSYLKMRRRYAGRNKKYVNCILKKEVAFSRFFQDLRLETEIRD